MRLHSLEAEELVLPFRFAFKHASCERRATETLWVTSRTEQGIVGRGESCPRSYVTGESVASAAAFVHAHRGELAATVHELSDVVRFSEAHRESIDGNPAAWCAVELALLDALGRTHARSVESLLGLAELEGPFRYSAVVGDVPLSRFREIVRLYRGLEMADFKLKLSGRLEDDAAKLDWLKASAIRVERVRLDANNLWTHLDAATRYLEALPRTFFAVEEPLVPSRHGELAELTRRLEIAVVLDESFTRLDQLDWLGEAAGRFLLNLRISKLGGLLRSFEIARAARRLAIPMVVGAQVGETSLLARAALPLAREAGDGLVAQEGAFGARLLEIDPCEPSLVFGRGGLLPAPRPGAGFGLAPRPARGKQLYWRLSETRPRRKPMTTTKSTPVDNGVNVQALLDAREALKQAPEAAQFKWSATCTWEYGTHSRSAIKKYFGLGKEHEHKREFTFETDHPEVFASEDKAATPVELVLAGLAGCLTAGVASVAQMREIQLRSVSATLEAGMDIQGILGIDRDVRNGFDGIKVTYKIDADATPDEIKAVVAQSQKRSAVYDIIVNPTNVTVEVD